MKNFILKGDILFSKNINEIKALNDGCVVCIDGKSAGVYSEIPDKYKNIPVKDFSKHIITTGFYDLHTHAPQFAFIGLGMDYPLLEWLDKKAFSEEMKFSDLEYAEKIYGTFAENLQNSVTSRACVFASVHEKATEILMDKLEKTGLSCYVGKVSMNRNAPEELCENDMDAEKSVKRLASLCSRKYENVKAIITPRFIPSCSDELLEKLAEIRDEYKLPVQSHLSENKSEQRLVHMLCPDSKFYGDAYDRHCLFGKDYKKGEFFKTVMAHCVWSDERELALMAQNGVFAAHCPASNVNLSSGIAPIRKMIDMNVKVGLGTDIAAGHSLSIFRAITDAIQVSKLYSLYIDENKKPLSFAEAFYIASKGGGEFFGKVGSFEEGYEFDAVVFDDSKISSSDNLSVTERFEKFVYSSGDVGGIRAKYVNGKSVIFKS